MSAADEIQAAIGKLAELKSDATAGPWFGWHQYNPLKGTKTGVEPRGGDVAETYSIHDAELIEVLHATIDAQLAILRSEVERQRESLILPYPLPEPLRAGYDADSLEEWVRSLGEDERDRYRSGVKPLILDLARSINGGD